MRGKKFYVCRGLRRNLELESLERYLNISSSCKKVFFGICFLLLHLKLLLEGSANDLFLQYTMAAKFNPTAYGRLVHLKQLSKGELFE